MNKYPIKMAPAFKDYIWGGDKLKKHWNKNSSFDKVAEAWELAAHINGSSVCENGEYKGMTLLELFEKYPEIVKPDYKGDKFPVLIKLIDAKDDLSIQVHPSDEYAKRENDSGKTEMWYIVDCDENAHLILGLTKTITKDEYKERIEKNTLSEVLNYVKVKKGDVFFIEPGTIHAICKGLLIAEIQQNSDITYRVYDYDRRDKDGNTRPLHIDKAIEVSNLNKQIEERVDADKVIVDKNSRRNICNCEYFNVSEVELSESIRLTAGDSFNAITFLSGEGYIEANEERYKYNKGDTYFIPAQMGLYRIVGDGLFLLTKI